MGRDHQQGWYQNRLMRNSKFCIWALRVLLLSLLLVLQGCASHTRSMADSIKPSSEKFQDPSCQRSFQLAPLHDDIRLSRSIATPPLLLAGGVAFLLPVLGVNMVLDAIDQVDASYVSEVCGGFATPVQNILEKVLLGAGFSFLPPLSK